MTQNSLYSSGNMETIHTSTIRGMAGEMWVLPHRKLRYRTSPNLAGGVVTEFSPNWIRSSSKSISDISWWEKGVFLRKRRARGQAALTSWLDSLQVGGQGSPRLKSARSSCPHSQLVSSACGPHETGQPCHILQEMLDGGRLEPRLSRVYM